MSEAPAPSPVAKLIDRFGVSALAEALGHANPSTVSTWKTRGRIPDRNWNAVLSVARSRGFTDITASTLALANGIGAPEPEVAA